jgi:hypothetical protein
MIQKIALLAGGLGAAAVLAFALGLTNFVFAGPDAAKTTADSQPVAQAADVGVAAAGKSSGNGPGAGQGAQTQPKKVVDKVYIAPTPAPKVVHVTQPAPTAPPAQPATTPTQTKPPTAAPVWHDDGPGQASEREGGRGGRQRGDD